MTTLKTHFVIISNVTDYFWISFNIKTFKKLFLGNDVVLCEINEICFMQISKDASCIAIVL